MITFRPTLKAKRRDPYLEKEIDTMKINKISIALGLMIAFVLFFQFAAHADETNEATKLTFSAPIQVPGKTLPAGTYLFQQSESYNDPNVVQIFSADRSVLYATVQTVSAERMDATGATTVTVAEQGAGNPDVLVKWFYPGRTIGHEFVYPKPQEQAIAQAAHETFVGNHLVSGGEAAGE
jgi:hypothetical protein